MARKREIIKVEYPQINVKIVTFADGTTLTMYWSQNIGAWVTIPA